MLLYKFKKMYGVTENVSMGQTARGHTCSPLLYKVCSKGGILHQHIAEHLPCLAILYAVHHCSVLFFFGVTVDTEAGVIAHSQR